MIFQREMIDKILAGEKTVTRRPVKCRFHASLLRGFVKMKTELPCRFEVGRTYFARPGRGQSPVARLHILSVETVALGLVDDEEARLEGFEFAEQFEDFWQLLYGEFNPEELVHRIEFRVVGSSEGER